MQDMICRNCWADVCGEDLGDHPGYLSYSCDECGREWDNYGEVHNKGNYAMRGKFNPDDKLDDVEHVVLGEDIDDPRRER